MVFALVLIPAIATVVRGVGEGYKKYRAGKDLRDNKQQSFPGWSLSREDWEALSPTARDIVARSTRKYQEIQGAHGRVHGGGWAVSTGDWATLSPEETAIMIKGMKAVGS